ncbi:Lactose regulatory protein LAC9 [Madurella fahalii]|uniref:Lactose regulatory protein LAC9 n=1 Tax=Madurella fahalii TaxID=1157608 RepID=A0ABQ0FY71_9PEZI
MDKRDKKAMEQPKRRACDECRGRKLACSKEIDGCARCKREGIKCVYSPQKRMGRPRKHRRAEAESPAEVSTPNEVPTITPSAAVVPEFEFDSTIGMDLDFSFLDMNNSDLNFLNLINSDSEFPTLPEQAMAGTYPKPPQHAAGGPRAFWAVSNHLNDINFDPPPFTSTPSQAPEITPEDVAQIMSAEIPETLPSLSPPSSSSPSTQPSPPEHDNTRTCGCLAALYLALDSLQTLPKEVAPAMNVARTAAKAAHDAILCPACGDPPLEAACKEPTRLSSLQSMLMLGALLPSLSNAYTRILAMVDAEAAAADAERRKIPFTLRGYGGLWGWMAAQDVVKCGSSKWLEGAELEPLLWRLTVRALLKMDVYGVNELTPGVDCNEARQPGLKDIIKMMEERSRRRHQMLDDLVASGAMEKPSHEYVPLSAQGDKPTCMRIIDIAKRSMDNLIIP